MLSTSPKLVTNHLGALSRYFSSDLNQHPRSSRKAFRVASCYTPALHGLVPVFFLHEALCRFQPAFKHDAARWVMGYGIWVEGHCHHTMGMRVRTHVCTRVNWLAVIGPAYSPSQKRTALHWPQRFEDSGLKRPHAKQFKTSALPGCADSTSVRSV